MDCKPLRTFVAVAELLHFTRAAEKLGCTQAAVTLHIQQLEKELAVRLFERLGRRVFLTDAGERLLVHARRILQSVEEAKTDIWNDGGSLRIGAAESLCIYRLPALLRLFRRLHPEVQVHIRLLSCGDYVPCLENNSVDVVMAIGEPVTASSCRCAAQTKEGVSVYVSPDHRLAGRVRVRAMDFADMPVLLTGDGCRYREAFLLALRTRGVVPRVVMETESVQAIKQAAINGIGAGVLPDMAVDDEVGGGTLLRLPYGGFATRLVSQILHHKNKRARRPLRTFLALAVDYYADLPVG